MAQALSAAAARRSWWPVAALLIGAAFAIRWKYFGNPIIHVDEDFYLLVGDRMLHGAVPYIDIWDRKPVGLFLIYAAIRMLGGGGILEYQIVATIFAGLTALLIAAMASRIAGRGPAILAGLVYLLWINFFGGEGGQSPVFYNLLMAGAAMLVLHAWLRRDARTIRWAGAGAMALVGVSLQIKYSAVFEGFAFGLVLLWLGWRADPRPLPRLIDAVLWVALALLPTGLAWGWYAAHGWSEQFVYANFTSITQRRHEEGVRVANRLGWSLAPLAPLLVTVLLSEWIMTSWQLPWRHRPEGTAIHRFLLLWFAASVAGYVLFGTFFNHYLLPVLVPLSVLAAPMFAHRRRFVGPAFAIFLLLFGYVGGDIQRRRNIKERGDAAFVNKVADAIRPGLSGGLFVFDGEPMLYYLLKAPLPTRWAFPNHLNFIRESGAIGVDPTTEVERIFDTRPRMVVDTETSNDDINHQTQDLARARLKRDYREVARFALPTDDQWRIVYQRKD